MDKTHVIITTGTKGEQTFSAPMPKASAIAQAYEQQREEDFGATRAVAPVKEKKS